MGFKPLPIGVENFQEIIEQGYYYVDKTAMIKELLEMRGKVNLFTRPGRFGKNFKLKYAPSAFLKKDIVTPDVCFRDYLS